MSEQGRADVRSIARKLRHEILTGENGVYLGSEDTLMERLHVSRPTLRQVARILEHEMLLVVRRGNVGGYYGRRPSTDGVVRAAALYLRMEKTRLTDMLTTSSVLTGEICLLAAASVDLDARAALSALHERLEKHDASADPIALFFADEEAIRAAILGMVDNPPLALVSTILHEFALHPSNKGVYEARADRQRLFREQRVKLVRAILDRDGELATLITRRYFQMMMSWVEEDGNSEGDKLLDDGIEKIADRGPR